MRCIILVLLLLSSCESAKFKPWLSYSDYDGQNIGINEAGSRFINSPLGSSWTVGLGTGGSTEPDASATDEALKVAKEVSSWWPDALISVAIALGLLLVAAFGFLAFMKAWKGLKRENGKTQQ